MTGAFPGQRDPASGRRVNDGAFAQLLGNVPYLFGGGDVSPRRRGHDHALLLPWSVDLLANGLNMRLSRDRARHFWREGARRGAAP